MATPMSPAQWLAAMRKWGVQLKEFPGWSTRGRPQQWGPVHGILIHHTGSDVQTDAYNRWLFTEGRASEGIPAPLAQATVDMDGDFWLGAYGRANQAGKGSGAVLDRIIAENYAGYDSELKPGADTTDGNARTYGFEVRYDGGQPMTAAQHATAVRAAAAICDHHGWSALSVIGHREWSGRKWDPGLCNMAGFRRDVRALLAAGPGGPVKPEPPKPEHPKPKPAEDEMALLARDNTNGAVWLFHAGGHVHVPDANYLNAIIWSGMAPAGMKDCAPITIAQLKELFPNRLTVTDADYIRRKVEERATVGQVAEASAVVAAAVVATVAAGMDDMRKAQIVAQIAEAVAVRIAESGLDGAAVADAVAAKLAEQVRVTGELRVNPNPTEE